MFSKAFWIETTERAVKTAAQAALGVFSALTAASVQGGFDWTAWGIGLGVTVGASLATSILSSLAGTKGTPSLVGTLTTSALWLVATVATILLIL